MKAGRSLSKRQLRNLDEISALAGPHNQGGTSSDDEQHNLPPKHQIGTGFAALLIPEDEESEDLPHSSKNRKAKKKKKASSIQSSSQPAENLDAQGPSLDSRRLSQSPAKRDKKTLKKSKAKEEKDDFEDFGKVLAELSIKYPDLQRVSASTSKMPTSSASPRNSLSSLLAVSLSHLDSEAEMRQFFGAKVVSRNKPSAVGASSSSRRQPVVQRSYLAHVQPNWWPVKMREGLTLSLLNKEELELQKSRHSWTLIEDEKWWRVAYSQKYKSVTDSFMKVVVAGDPERFWSILNKLPWHADTLLQLSEVYRYREEYSQAVDFVERALFAYERCFVGAFNFTSGVNRLDFDYVENRPFFMAIHQQVVDLQRRGCIRTAFEFARLLYSLDPWTDPYGALFYLDYLAIKAGMDQWLLDLFDYFSQIFENGQSLKMRIDPTLLPGWCYARALVLRIREQNKKANIHTESTAALEDAIRSFPAVVPLLADKIDIPLSAEIRGRQHFRIHTDASLLTIQEGVEHILANIYVTRSFFLWKDTTYSEWFRETVIKLCSVGNAELPSTDRRSRFLDLYNLTCPTFSVYRHVFVQGDSFRRLTAFLPPIILQRRLLTCDPLPPPTYVRIYDEAFFKGSDDLFTPGLRPRQRRAADARRLRQLIPDQVSREQLEAIFEAHPQLAARFPGGLVQFIETVAHMQEDEINQMLLDQAIMNEVALHQQQADRREGAMPGEMPGGDDEVMVQFVDMAELGENADQEALPYDEAHSESADTASPALEVLADEEEEGEDPDSSREEDMALMPIRILRTVINRLWGRQATADSSDSSDDSEGTNVRDTTGVD